MEAPVHRVLDTDHSNVAGDGRWKEELLPRATEVGGTLNHCHPVTAIQGHLDVVGVGPTL